jgi:hypothetical protein
MLDKHFSTQELQELTFDLGIDLENLPGTGKLTQCRELVTYIMRRERKTRPQMADLLAACVHLRPDTAWKDAFAGLLLKELPQEPFYPYPYNTVAMRELLLYAFEDDMALAKFCQQHFPDILTHFGSGKSFREKVQALIGYCQRRELWPNLLSLMKANYPDAYAKLAPYETHP